ncbi:MAG: hypothetical protein P1V81_15380 [Planctomycetota bacterium]|nr:hypothetical protein [Planctomycetota bacterium]
MSNEKIPTNAPRPGGPLAGACERVLARLPELVDGGLVPLEEARDLGHLEACRSCAAEAEDWRRFHGELGAAVGGPSTAPIGLVASLDARLAGLTIAPAPAEPRPRVVLRPLQSLVAAAASLVLLFGVEAFGSAMDSEAQRPFLGPAGVEAELEVWPLGFGLPAGLIPGVKTGPGGADVPVGELLEVVR